LAIPPPPPPAANAAVDTLNASTEIVVSMMERMTVLLFESIVPDIPAGATKLR
jgi:hypothetical protein